MKNVDWRPVGAILLCVGLVATGCSGKSKATTNVAESARLAEMYLENNRLDSAAAEYRRLAQALPNDPKPHIALAEILLKLGEFKDAEASARRAFQLDSANVDRRITVARVLELSGQKAEAKAELEKATAKEPVDPKIWYALADLARSSNDSAGLAAAKEYLVKTSAAAPSNIAVKTQLAEALSMSGDPEGALRELEQLEELSPKPPPDAETALRDAIRALRAKDLPRGRAAIAELHRFLRLTQKYQEGLLALQGPEGEVPGFQELIPASSAEMYERRNIDPRALQFRIKEQPRAQWLDSNAAAGSVPGALAVGDYDGDGQYDVYASVGAGKPARLLHWTPATHWADTAPGTGIAVTDAVLAEFSDFNNDGHTDLYVVDASDKGHLFINDRTGKFTDEASKAGVASPGKVRKILVVDVDHDADLDLFLVTEGGNRCYRNNSDGTFKDVTSEIGLAGGAQGRDAVFGYFDPDGMIDLAVVTDDRKFHLYQNSSLRRFSDRGAGSGVALGSAPAALVSSDYDNDGYFDLVVIGARGETELFRATAEGLFVADRRTSAATFSALKSIAVKSATFTDYDNDGRLDLAVSGSATGAGKPVALFRNDGGGKFSDQSAILTVSGKTYGRVVSADIDDDRDLDLIVESPNGPREIGNFGGNKNLAIKVKLSALGTGSTKNNSWGIGARIDFRATDLLATRVVTDRVTLIGMGGRLKPDVVRIEWPNGVPQTIYLPGADQDWYDKKIMKSSCAFIYAWNGTRFEFLNDVMWQSALGMPVGIGGNGRSLYAPPGASREYIKIPGTALVPKDGKYLIQFTEELWETSYTDELELIAVDHPDSIEVFVDEKFVPPGHITSLNLRQSHRIRSPVSAVDDRGNDVLPQLLAADNVYVSDLMPLEYQGTAEPHDLIIDLGPDLGNGPVLLLMRGWIFPTDASINAAMSQGKHPPLKSPSLEVMGANGKWRTAIADIGFPSGKDKTVIVDLTGKFPTSDHRVRIRTNMLVYWDHATVATEIKSPLSRVTTLEPSSADLHYRGFSAMYRRGGRYGPHWFNYDSVSTDPAWLPIQGMVTRFGEVLPLLKSSDDQFVIMAAGDELTLGFDATALPPLPAGWKRDFLFFSVGWIKDGDFNTAHGGTVEPLPFHGMKSYPYAGSERYPSDAARTSYRKTYNTRPSAPEGRSRLPGDSKAK